jgi:small-conductance mechanosensitive channel
MNATAWLSPLRRAARAASAASRTALAIVALLASLASAQQARTDIAGPAAVPLPEARVVVANRTITTFRSQFLGLSPAERARRTQHIVRELLDRGGDIKVSVQPVPQGNVILMNGELALYLMNDDVDRLRGETLDSATQAATQALVRVIDETRESRDRRRLIIGSVWVAGATLALALALWLLWRVRDWLVVRIAAALETGTKGISFAGTRILQFERLLVVARWLVRLLTLALGAFLCYRWLSFSLGQFPYTRPWSEQLDGFLVGVASRIGGGVLGALPDLALAMVIFVLAWAVTRSLAPFFDRVQRGSTAVGPLDRDTVRPTRRIVNVAVWLFAVVMAYPYLPGSDSEAFKGMSVLIGLMITVGGSSLIGQAASGLILMYSRTLRVGDYIRIDEHEGTVTELGTFTTRIRTGLGEEVTLPNGVVLGTVTKNYSRTPGGQGYVVDTVVTIGYDTPWRQVEAMLVEAAQRTRGVVASPAPRVFQTALSDFYVEYRLVCHAVPRDPRPRAELLAELHANIQDAFNAYGVQIMSPHYLGDPTSPKVVAREQWFAKPAVAPRSQDDTGGAAGGGGTSR